MRELLSLTVTRPDGKTITLRINWRMYLLEMVGFALVFGLTGHVKWAVATATGFALAFIALLSWNLWKWSKQ